MTDETPPEESVVADEKREALLADLSENLGEILSSRTFALMKTYGYV